MEEFIKGKLDVEIKVVRCKLSGKVILTTLEGEEEKRKVMEQKFKLKGGECVFGTFCHRKRRRYKRD